MILQKLLELYEALAQQDDSDISKPGWAKASVSYALEIDAEGKLIGVQSIMIKSRDGKKEEPLELSLPALGGAKGKGFKPNFLWGNCAYLLCLDSKGNPKRVKKCFDASKALHIKLLKDASAPEAQALYRFFENFNEETTIADAELSTKQLDKLKGKDKVKITFLFDGMLISKYPSMAAIWQRYYENGTDDKPDAKSQGEPMRCLITGDSAVPMRIHPMIKGVMGTRPSGAALISFNESAFCSYHREQNFNAPVSKYGAFAYTTALQYLVSDRAHNRRIGDATVLYWAQDAQLQYNNFFSFLLDDEDAKENEIVSDSQLNDIMDKIASGKNASWDDLPVSPDNNFYILSISPNSARLSVRFFINNTFGSMVTNIKKHYDGIEIVKDNRDSRDITSTQELLRETINPNSKDKTLMPHMASDVLKAVITGGRYPATLFSQTLLRIRAEKNITYGRAAIIKGYLIRNTNDNKIREVLTVSLNEQSDYTPYILGRLFSVLEGTQLAMNQDINTTITDRFFNSACTTPSAVFPILLKLANNHLSSMDDKRRIFWSRKISELVDKLAENMPKSLTLYQQGAFIIGYYHQTQARYQKAPTDAQSTPESEPSSTESTITKEEI